ncbi:MAG: hypothetical protein Q9224_003625, partial [Gallowayella concinna]
MTPELVFINTNRPEDAKSTAQRRAVRSQAAKDHSQSSGSSNDGPKRRRHRKLLAVELEVAIDESESSKDDSPPRNIDYEASSFVGDHPYRDDIAVNVDYSAVLPPSHMPGAGWAYPFVPYPEQEFVPAILSHYLSEMAVDIPELDHPGAKGALRSIWFPAVIANQATLNCTPEVLYKLKQDAITTINRGLQDPQLATSDQLIGAVAKMAAYEAGFAGDEVQYHMHMKGLVKMVELRGGLQSLGLNGLLARMLLWIDLNAAFILQTHLYFSHTDALPGHTVPEPNPGHFL